ncbi:hypothetical protein [Flavobacterium sp. GP15]|uniref:hypothetical protein n=1 Tax=Flavobacterium sp. GP15 TaxID=2758567 RepID=UPI00165E327C|nr:hypothetical protein [Flavobacterium sp. GP15]
MRYYLTLIFATSLLMSSCKKEDTIDNNTIKTTVVPFTEVGTQMKAQQSQANAQQQQVVTNNSVAAAPVAKGMNPEHGRPGHRCDIPVGAPLNSPAAAKNQQSAPAPTMTYTTTATPSETVVTAEGMNPPHGQANHRCDIAVGEPLPKE